MKKNEKSNVLIFENSLSASQKNDANITYMY